MAAGKPLLDLDLVGVLHGSIIEFCRRAPKW
ncbi:hypothetical protein ABIB82_004774 [Bradyrhizobium sp. i1.8.4]